MKTHFGGSNYFMGNALQVSSNGELVNYHHQSLGSPRTWSMLNALKPTRRINVYAWYEQGSNHQILGAIGSNNNRAHDTSTKKTFGQHTATNQPDSKHGKRLRI